MITIPSAPEFPVNESCDTDQGAPRRTGFGMLVAFIFSKLSNIPFSVLITICAGFLSSALILCGTIGLFSNPSGIPFIVSICVFVLETLVIAYYLLRFFNGRKMFKAQPKMYVIYIALVLQVINSGLTYQCNTTRNFSDCFNLSCTENYTSLAFGLFFVIIFNLTIIFLYFYPIIVKMLFNSHYPLCHRIFLFFSSGVLHLWVPFLVVSTRVLDEEPVYFLIMTCLFVSQLITTTLLFIFVSAPSSETVSVLLDLNRESVSVGLITILPYSVFILAGSIIYGPATSITLRAYLNTRLSRARSTCINIGIAIVLALIAFITLKLRSCSDEFHEFAHNHYESIGFDKDKKTKPNA